MKLRDVKPILNELSYPSNIGMMEMFKFYQTASGEQKAEMKTLLAAKDFKKAWELLQQVTGVKLHEVFASPTALPSQDGNGVIFDEGDLVETPEGPGQIMSKPSANGEYAVKLKSGKTITVISIKMTLASKKA
jgi:hypothetical protein